jgi:hypothetical protein
LWRHVVISLDWPGSPEMQLAGWRLWRPGQAKLRKLSPLPSAARFSRPVWDEFLLQGQCLVLSAEDTELTPSQASRLWLFGDPRGSGAIAPLILLNLWHDDPVTSYAEYIVEPGRLVEKVYGSVPGQPVGQHGEYEVALLGPLQVDENANSAFEPFIRRLAGCFDAWSSRTDAGSRSNKQRIQRAGRGLVDTARKVGFDADVTMPDDASQVAFEYVTALEYLLSGKQEASTDLRRRTAQRAAMLIARSDAEREKVFRAVHQSYQVRNSIAHGNDPHPKELRTTTSVMREILRRALTAAIALGPDVALSSLCDAAILSRSTTDKNIRTAVDAVRPTGRILRD